MPTASLSTVCEITAAIKPPRAYFLDFPIGCPAGKPNEPELQREILKTVLAQAPKFGDNWSMFEMPFQWSEDGSRAWEEELKTIYRQGLQTVKAHVADHIRCGQSLVGQEKEFVIRCNC